MVYYTVFKKAGVIECHVGRNEQDVANGRSMSLMNPNYSQLREWLDVCEACCHEYVEPVGEDVEPL